MDPNFFEPIFFSTKMFFGPTNGGKEAIVLYSSIKKLQQTTKYHITKDTFNMEIGEADDERISGKIQCLNGLVINANSVGPKIKPPVRLCIPLGLDHFLVNHLRQSTCSPG